MDVVSLLVSATAMLVVAVVTSYSYVTTKELKKDVDENMRSVVDQINSAQFYKYKFDKLQESNIKNVDVNTRVVNENLQQLRKQIDNTQSTLTNRMRNVEDTVVKKTDLSAGMDYVKTGKIRLGDQHMLSGVGDAHVAKPDGWLRLFDKDGKDYYGGFAAGKLYSRDYAQLNGSVDVNGQLNVRGGKSAHNPQGLGTHFAHSDGNNYIRGDTMVRGNMKNVGDMTIGEHLAVKGGKSEHNPAAWGTHFPWSGDQKNYIRGDTEIRGNTENIGDLNVGRHLNVQGKLFFRDPTKANAGNSGNNTDPYYLEKVIHAGNNSSLRLTINDDADESFQVWGNSCGEAGGCAGPGALKHHFQANGDVMHKGNMTVEKSTTSGPLQVRAIAGDNAQNAWLSARSGDNMVHVGGNTSIQGIVSSGNKPFGIWDSTGERMLFSKGSTRVNSDLYAQRLCIGSTCLDESELRRLKTKL